jgi:hypothetical protein
MIQNTFCLQLPFVASFSLVVTAISATTIFAQTTPTSTVDLTSPNLQVHASLSQNNPPGTPLPDRLRTAQSIAASKGIPWRGIDIVSGDEVGNVAGLNNTSLLTLYQKRACLADAIVVGHPTSWLHHLSASGTAVYGDYDFAIETVLKDNLKDPFRLRPDILVTRPGGSLTLANGPVTFQSDGFPHLQADLSYLLLLKYIPASSGYQTIDSFSTLVVKGSSWAIARKAFSSLVIPGFTRGTLEGTISQWLRSCK